MAAAMAPPRIRIGYTSVAWVTEIFARDFYRMVPDGVSLALVTIQQSEFGKGEMDRLYEATLEGARRLARSGVDLVVLGGRPVLLAQGAENIDAICARLGREIGAPVTCDATAQLLAFRALGSQRIATAHPFGDDHNGRHDGMIADMGLTPAGSLGCGSNLVGLPDLPPQTALELGRRAAGLFPEADTLLFPCPHWEVVGAIAPLEREFGVNVVANLQATVWHALRTCGYKAANDGYGRLLAAH